MGGDSPRHAHGEGGSGFEYTSIEYTEPEQIREQATVILERMNSRDWASMALDEQAAKLAQDTSDLWKVHCFREGNTQTPSRLCVSLRTAME